MQRTLNGALVWFRRDLRAHDHAALHAALRAAGKVWCVFIYDTDILRALPKLDRRVEFIVESIAELDANLARLGSQHGNKGVRLLTRHGSARKEVVSLARELGVQAVFANHDDDPFALERDAEVRKSLGAIGIAMHTSKDHVIFERSEVLTKSATTYGVFTPYKNAWLKKIEPFFVEAYPIERHAAGLALPPAGVATPLPR